MVALLVLTLIVVPVTVIQTLSNESAQIVLVVTSSALFTLVISGLTNARAIEIFVAGAT